MEIHKPCIMIQVRHYVQFHQIKFDSSPLARLLVILRTSEKELQGVCKLFLGPLG